MQVSVNTHRTAIASLSSSIHLQAVDISNITSINVNQTNTINSHITAIGNLETSIANAIEVSKPWCAGFILANGNIATNYGRVGFVINGTFSDRRRIGMDVEHPLQRRCVCIMSPDVGARAMLAFNVFVESDPRNITFWISKSDGLAAFRDFSFIVF